MKKTVRQNQSFIDVILEGCGTMDAAMQVAADNGKPLSYMPAVDSEMDITDAAVAMSNKDVLHNFELNGIEIGTKFDLLGASAIASEEGELLISEDNKILVTEQTSI